MCVKVSFVVGSSRGFICAILITSSGFIQHFDGFKVEVYLPPLTTEVRDFQTIRSSRLVMFLGKGVLKICSKFIEEKPCRSEILIKLLKPKCGFNKVALATLLKSYFGMGVLL